MTNTTSPLLRWKTLVRLALSAQTSRRKKKKRGKNKKVRCCKCGEENARYKKHNAETGRYDLDARCKYCRTKEHRGRPPKWATRYCDFDTICRTLNKQLKTTKKEWQIGTTKYGQKYMPPIWCPDCKSLVTTTSIDSFANGQCGCKCKKSEPWLKRYEEFRDLCIERGKELRTTKKEWQIGTTKYGQKYMPPIWCPDCKSIVTTTSIGHFANNGRCGCKCTKMELWLERYEEFRDLCIERGKELRTTKQEWQIGTTKYGQKYMPPIWCLDCKSIVTTTSIGHFANGQCGCKCTKRELWLKRYEEFRDICTERGKELRTTKQEWQIGTTKYGKKYMPPIWCPDCKSIVTTTSIDHFVNGHCGCGCHNKTERRIFETIRDSFPELVVHQNHRFTCDGWQTSYQAEADIVVCRLDGSELAVIEIDGPHHFDPNFCYSGKQLENTSRFVEIVQRDCLKVKHWHERKVSTLRLVWNGNGIDDMSITFIRDCLKTSNIPITRVSDHNKYDGVKKALQHATQVTNNYKYVESLL